jgi:hypothetical protein
VKEHAKAKNKIKLGQACFETEKMGHDSVKPASHEAEMFTAVANREIQQRNKQANLYCSKLEASSTSSAVSEILFPRKKDRVSREFYCSQKTRPSDETNA